VDDDVEFLYAVYASTRQEELERLDWSPEQKDVFLRFQFEAQQAYYLDQFPSARYSIILLNQTPAGRLYVDRRENEIRIIDIALLPDRRGRGVGGELMRSILDEAAGQSRPVRIHVGKENVAMRLYERLGFRRLEDHGVYVLMEWNCG
jgi:ribosomal protein S18 acetylase RimI-like enzyme